VRFTFDSTGFSYLWDSTQVGNSCLVNVVTKLKDIDTQHWVTEVTENSLCSNYKLIKDRHEIETYLTKLNDRIRILMTQFRCGNHNLPVTASRRNHASEPCPICPLCTKNSPGDEYHYVLECPFFNDERTKYIPLYYRSRPNTLKYQQLFNAKNLRLLYRLGKLVTSVVNKFKLL